MLKIVADSKIPFVSEAFSSFAKIERTASEDLSSRKVRDADALLVRSESRVDEQLLEDSGVRFVGSCTIGTDHVDLDYLAGRSIPFANAPGCNARSVAEYVMACMLETLPIRGCSLAQLRLGVVGFGNVGSSVVRLANALGIETLVNDPPMEESGAPGSYSSLGAVLGCDVVTAHVPLERQGAHPTFHLIGPEELAQMPDEALLINTSRGPVVDGRALLAELRQARLRAILDVWEGEPKPDLSLFKLVEFGTPHIAGYSLDGKLRGTTMIYDALCAVFDVCGDWTGEGCLPDVEPFVLDLTARRADDLELLTETFRGRYRIRDDFRRMRHLIALPSDERAGFFRDLRRTYPTRRELPSLTVQLPAGHKELGLMLDGLGVRIR